jgi:hypothetical protein
MSKNICNVFVAIILYLSIFGIIYLLISTRKQGIRLSIILVVYKNTEIIIILLTFPSNTLFLTLSN